MTDTGVNYATSIVRLKDILAANFRANPEYELVLYDRLPQNERVALAGLKQDPDLYAVLRPRQPGLNIKAVDRETALLYDSLHEPGPLPSYVRQRQGAEANLAVVRLVLEGMLEIEVGECFVSGAAAHARLYAASATPIGGFLNQISLTALQYAASLSIADRITLAARLYQYNRLPATPRWRQLLPDASAATRYLELRPNGHLGTILERNWLGSPSTSYSPTWCGWVRRGGMDEECRYKLYVSPQPEYLPATFERTLEVLTDTAAQAFKVGADCYGFLRPDKLVIYFSSRNDALTAATLLQSTLAGIAAHGVPFTAEISTDGLISWGVDPPTGTRLLPWEGSSWRRWLTDRLAAALIAARDAAVALPAWQFALDRIAIEGVDPQTWLPEAICG